MSNTYSNAFDDKSDYESSYESDLDLIVERIKLKKELEIQQSVLFEIMEMARHYKVDFAFPTTTQYVKQIPAQPGNPATPAN